MSRPRLRFAVPAVGVCVAVGLFAVLGASPAPGQAPRAAAVKRTAKPKVTVITVTAGKPTELAFVVSKTSMVSPGTIVFKVTNKGVAFHDFKLCARPATSASTTPNACTGKKTPILKHNQSATLTITVTRIGKYTFICSVPGHAAVGMKGLLGIGIPVTADEQRTASKPSSGTSSGGGAGGGSSGGGHSSGGGGGEVGPAVGCPPGVSVKASGNADADGDELGTEPDDQDGCV